MATLPDQPIVKSQTTGGGPRPTVGRHDAASAGSHHGTLNVTVAVDQATGTKTLSFDRAITAAEASTFLFGNATQSYVLKPAGNSGGGKSQRFVLATGDVATLMSMRSSVRDGLIQASVLRSNVAPYAMGKWVPEKIQKEIKSGSLPKGVTRYKTEGPWGDFVVWKGNVSYEVYQEFPSDIEYYEEVAGGGGQTARLLHYAYTQWNKDMAYFVETKGLSPDEARSEIRRIYGELTAGIIGAAATMVSMGAGITALGNAMRASSRQVSNGVKARYIPPPKVRPVNGKVNVGGGFETPNMTNLNPVRANSGGPTSGIPNHVRASMEQMDQVIEQKSVQYLMSSKLRYGDVNWTQAANAAARVMQPGGKVQMNVWCSRAEAAALKGAFESAGFKNVSVTGDSVGTMLEAIW